MPLVRPGRQRSFFFGLSFAVVLAAWPASPAHAKGGGFLSGLFKGLGKGIGKGIGKAASKGGGAVLRGVGKGAAKAASRGAAAAVRGSGRGAQAVAARAARGRLSSLGGNRLRIDARAAGRPLASHPMAEDRLRALSQARQIELRAAPVDLAVADVGPGRPLLSMRVDLRAPRLDARAVVFVRPGATAPASPVRPVPAASPSGPARVASTPGSGTRLEARRLSARAGTAHRRRPRLRLPSRHGHARICSMLSGVDGELEVDASGEDEVLLASRPLEEPIVDAALDREEAAAQGERATSPRAVSLLELSLDPDDADLWLDGVLVPHGPGPVTVGLTGGSHVLELVHPERRGLAVSFLADPGQRYRLSLSMKPAPAPAAPAPFGPLPGIPSVDDPQVDPAR